MIEKDNKTHDRFKIPSGFGGPSWEERCDEFYRVCMGEPEHLNLFEELRYKALGLRYKALCAYRELSKCINKAKRTLKYRG